MHSIGGSGDAQHCLLFVPPAGAPVADVEHTMTAGNMGKPSQVNALVPVGSGYALTVPAVTSWVLRCGLHPALAVVAHSHSGIAAPLRNLIGWRLCCAPVLWIAVQLCCAELCRAMLCLQVLPSWRTTFSLRRLDRYRTVQPPVSQDGDPAQAECALCVLCISHLAVGG